MLDVTDPDLLAWKQEHVHNGQIPANDCAGAVILSLALAPFSNRITTFRRIGGLFGFI